MRRARGVLLVVAAVVAAGVLVDTVVRRPPDARAEDEAADPVERARQLAAEAEPFFRDAGDTEASNAERRKARQEAYTRLKEARGLLDAVLDKSPDRTEELDDLYSHIMMMLFWVKKEAAIGELDGHSSATSSGPRDPGSGSGGGIAGTSGPKPPTARPPTPPAGTGPAPEAPAAEPEVPAGPSPADELAVIAEYEKAHPGDVPGLYDRYTGFLARFADPSLPEYEQALDRRRALDEKLKDVYRTLRDDDPEALAEQGDADIERLVQQLVVDLRPDADETVRTRAARYLGSLGSSLAVTPLIDTLREEPGTPIAEAAAAALAAIGGKVTCMRLARTQGDPVVESHVADILGAIVARGGPEGRIAGDTLAEYVMARDAGLLPGAVEQLRAAGRAGALGLARLLGATDPAERAALIEHLGAQGEPRAATYLAHFLKAGAVGIEKDHARAARSAIETLGKSTVRYLIPALDDAAVSAWTAEMLRRLTGARPRDDKRRTWERWYSKNRRDFR